MKGKCLKSVVPILLGLCLISPSVCWAGFGSELLKSLGKTARETIRDMIAEGGNTIAEIRATKKDAEMQAFFRKLTDKAQSQYKAAENGDVEAQVSVAAYFAGGIFGYPKDYEQSFYWYYMAAEQGNGKSQEILGDYCRFGLGTQQNMEEALAWYVIGAEKDNDLCKIKAGDCYLLGLGCKKDESVAWAFYDDANNLLQRTSNLWVQNAVNLRFGYCYMHGLGCEKNGEFAVAMFKEGIAAYENDAKNNKKMADAMFSTYAPTLYMLHVYLAQCYHNGIGCDINRKMAAKELKIAQKIHDRIKNSQKSFSGKVFIANEFFYNDCCKFVREVVLNKQ